MSPNANTVNFKGLTDNIVCNETQVPLLPTTPDLDFSQGSHLSDGANLYLFGGKMSGSGKGHTRTQKYDMAANTWTTVKPMTVSRYQATVVQLSEEELLVAGSKFSKLVTSLL